MVEPSTTTARVRARSDPLAGRGRRLDAHHFTALIAADVQQRTCWGVDPLPPEETDPPIIAAVGPPA